MYLELLFFQGTLYKGFVAPHLVQRYIKRERECRESGLERFAKAGARRHYNHVWLFIILLGSKYV